MVLTLRPDQVAPSFLSLFLVGFTAIRPFSTDSTTITSVSLST